MATLDHLNLTVRNLRESIDWYERIFSFKKVEGEDSGPYGPLAILRSEDSMLCIYESPELKSPKSTEENDHHISHFGLRVPDKPKWEEIVKKENLNVDYGGEWRYPHSTSWYINDPTGYRIEVAYWDKDFIQF